MQIIGNASLGILLGLIEPITLCISQSYIIRECGQTFVGIILTEQNTILGTRGEHTIRLIHTFVRQIIDEYANITLVM